MKNGINLNLYKHEIIYHSLVLTPGERFGLDLMFKPGNRLEYDNEINPGFVLIVILRSERILYDEFGKNFNLKAGMCFKRIPGRAETLRTKYCCQRQLGYILRRNILSKYSYYPKRITEKNLQKAVELSRFRGRN